MKISSEGGIEYGGKQLFLDQHLLKEENIKWIFPVNDISSLGKHLFSLNIKKIQHVPRTKNRINKTNSW